MEFLRTGSLPPTAKSDAIHLAVATIARADYLLTWNCRHLANAQILRRLERESIRFGWELPTVHASGIDGKIMGMKPNPILEEVWRIKDELASEATMSAACARTPGSGPRNIPTPAPW